jgi:uncharacterized membrane protein YtjA (UPF0391 family)
MDVTMQAKSVERRHPYAELGNDFLVLALIAAVCGLTGVAGTASHIARVLSVVFLVMWVVSALIGRDRPVS